jgi:hypothetical protein
MREHQSKLLCVPEFAEALARISHQLFATGFESVESAQCILTLSPQR